MRNHQSEKTLLETAQAEASHAADAYLFTTENGQAMDAESFQDAIVHTLYVHASTGIPQELERDHQHMTYLQTLVRIHAFFSKLRRGLNRGEVDALKKM